MPSEDNQAIVDAIERKIGSTNTLYILQGATILILFIVSYVGFHHINATNDILKEFIIEVKINSKNRETTALLAQQVLNFDNTINKLDTRLTSFIESQKEFNDRRMMVLEAAKNYINQNPIELLRKGK